MTATARAIAQLVKDIKKAEREGAESRRLREIRALTVDNQLYCEGRR